MDRIKTNNAFQVAYHLSRSDRPVSLSLGENGEKRFIIEGETLYQDDLRYHAGKALVNPLVFENLFRYLENAGQWETRRRLDLSVDARNGDNHGNDDTEEIDLLADDLETEES